MIYAKNWQNQILATDEEVEELAFSARYSTDGYQVGDVVEALSASHGIPWVGRTKSLHTVLKSVGQTMTLQSTLSNVIITVTDNEELAGGVRSLGLPIFCSEDWHILPTFTFQEVEELSSKWDKTLQIHDRYYSDGVTILERIKQANWGKRNDLREERRDIY